MNWTKEIPTIDGWYWIKTDWTAFIDYVNSGSMCEWNRVDEEWEDVKLDPESGYEFYGPLVEPE